MNSLTSAITAATLVLAGTNAWSQFVKGNEAISELPNGTVQVETPPIPKTGPASKMTPCDAEAKCHGGAWLMVETSEGLMECTEAYARPKSCRNSTLGTTKTSRLWVVKSKGLWLQCQYPTLTSKCVNMLAPPPNNLPYSAVQ